MGISARLFCLLTSQLSSANGRQQQKMGGDGDQDIYSSGLILMSVAEFLPQRPHFVGEWSNLQSQL